MGPVQTLPLPAGAEVSAFGEGSIYFVGTATTIIRCSAFTILTDPNFLHAGDHVHLGYGLTSQRRTNPAIAIDELPALDLCVLSHMHGDHWDQVAATNLHKTLPIITTQHATKTLVQQGFTNLHPLETWESIVFTKTEITLRITAMPGRHGPGLLNALLPPVMGSLLEWSMGDAPVHFRLYISGDTLVYEDLHEIPRRHPAIDLALLHLGGTRVLGVLLTMDAKQGVQAIRIIQPHEAIPIHYNDYTVFKSPLEDFVRAVEEAQLPTVVHYLRHGETFTFPVTPR